MTRRLFAAVLPPPEVVEWLDDLLTGRRETGSGLRWNPPHQWHVTTVFCPEVTETQLDEFSDGLAETASEAQPFRLRIAGGGAFPEMVRARHLICLLDDPDAGLPRLARGCRRAARLAGLPVEARPYQPHLTLARANRPSDLSYWQPALDELVSPWFQVDELVLVESRISTAKGVGATYSGIADFDLG